ncbi:MAG: 5-formyltetrahydrofolate cyclo-ligase [Proteobacteria bacterium]|nr:5-formyltetrahydrofolate cyclo-ligase [Pseudomonadota bacterium]
MNLLEEKKTLRTELKKRRAAIPETQRATMNKQIIKNLHNINDFNNAQSAFCYVSYQAEVETRHLLDEILGRGIYLAVPKIISNTKMIAVPINDQTELEPDNLGIPTPKSDQVATNPIDIAITPGLGFTSSGERLGYGRGYYDRWFEHNVVKTKVGLAFEAQIVDTLPTETTDVLLDIIVTEQRIIDVRNSL